MKNKSNKPNRDWSFVSSTSSDKEVTNTKYKVNFSCSRGKEEDMTI